MTWTAVYLVCFWLGFSLSAVSWLLGAAATHVPHLPHAHPHLPHAAPQAHGAAAHGGHPPGAADSPSFFNFATLTAFLAWFGGAGYLLTRYAEVWPVLAFAGALAVGLAGASLMFALVARVLWSPNENLDPDDYDVVGQVGVVSSPIRDGGTGEILFALAGARRVAGARSDDGGAIGKGVEIVIVRYEKGLAYVRTWADLSSESART
jgi:membrane protein implicated in regulation of membrane protease activity